VRSQQDTTALPASRPFAGRQAGYDYLADEQHYRSLADRVLAGLRQGGRIVLVTGDPPVNLSSLAAALTEVTAGKHTVLRLRVGANSTSRSCAVPPALHRSFCSIRRRGCWMDSSQNSAAISPRRQPPRRPDPRRAWLGPSARKTRAEPVRRRTCDPLQLLRARPR
jgi:hypothetical protein